MVLELLAIAIAIVFSFDFFNGFHDAANAIATVVATKVLTPVKAVGLAAVGNFVGMVFITNAIAETIGKGIIDTRVLGVGSGSLTDPQILHSMAIIMGGVLGAIVWDVLTWLWGLPVSSSHALIGGIVGSTSLAAGVGAVLLPSAENMILFLGLTGSVFGLGVAVFVAWSWWAKRPLTLGTILLAGLVAGLLPSVFLGRILLRGIVQIVVYMVAAPLVGLIAAFSLALVLIRLFRKSTPSKVNHEFRRLQLISCCIYRVTPRTNDASTGMCFTTVILIVCPTGCSLGSRT